MKVSEQWLREWVNPDLSLEEIGQQLTMAGCEVEALEPVATNFSGVVVAEVTRVTKHPDADKLNICQVNYGQTDLLQIVCGAPNVHAGMKAPLAMIGANLPLQDGTVLKIKKGKLRGQVSEGMLCSATELGMGDSTDGLLALPSDAVVGKDLRDYLSLNDQVLELNITPNRGDCLSIAGVAREVSVLSNTRLCAPMIEAVPATHQDIVPVTLEADEACPRYIGRVIRHINPKAQTPLWMREKLRRQGLRSISPLVDVTNYVLLELGQPMHAFDLAKLQGGISVRMAADNEPLTLLDGTAIQLKANTLLITDARGPIAMAGIMGGLATAVSDTTQHVFLESAHFTPTTIAGRARQYGLQTDASYRYERGVSVELCNQAMERATALILAICGGEAGPITDVTAAHNIAKKRTVTLRYARIERVLGIRLAKEEVVNILQRLDCQLTVTDEGWHVTIPLARFDISLEEDLIEEVARVHGYDAIPARLRPLKPKLNLALETQVTPNTLMTPLLQRGYQEAVTFSFVDEAMEKHIAPTLERIRLANPISADLGVMRSSLWSGLLKAMIYNLNRQQQRVRLFEVGPAFLLQEGAIQQQQKIAGVVTGLATPEQWAQPKRKVDFYDIKGDVESVLAQISGETFHFIPITHSALHSGQSAQIAMGNKEVGWIGALHPVLEKQLGFDQSIYLFELDMALLQSRVLPTYQAVSKFPAIRRDLSLLVDQSVLAQALDTSIKKHAAPQLMSWQIFDLYRGEGVESGKKSLALSLILQDFSRTLDDAVVNNIVMQIVKGLEKDIGAILR